MAEEPSRLRVALVRSGAFPAGSLAATSRAAFDLAGHLVGVLNGIELWRAADLGGEPDPSPEWWDARPDRAARVTTARLEVLSSIQNLQSKWDHLVAPLGLKDSPIARACSESLRNLLSIFRMRGCVPDPRHLESKLPEAWDPEPEGERERQAREMYDGIAERVQRRSMPPTERECRTAAAALGEHAHLSTARLRRNDAEGGHGARLTSEEVDHLHRERAEWEVQIRRFDLSLRDLHELLAVLASDRSEATASPRSFTKASETAATIRASEHADVPTQSATGKHAPAGWMSERQLAEFYGVPESRRRTLRRRLEEYREAHLGDDRRVRIEGNQSKNQPKYTFGADYAFREVIQPLLDSTRA